MSPGNVSFDDLSLGADESPYDTESEIKVVKRLNFQHTKLEIKFVRKAVSNIVKDERVIDISPADQDMTKADSDLIQAVNDNESLLVEARNLIMMMEFIYILKNKSLPKMVADALKDHLSELLSDTLKTILPKLLKDSIKMVLTVEVPKLIIKPKEFTVVHELLKYYITMLDMADVNIPEQTLTALVVYSAEEKGSEEKLTNDEPPFKKLKFLVPNPNIPSPTPLKSLMPQGIRPPAVIDMPLDQFTDSLFNISSSKLSPTPPLIVSDKGKGIAPKEDIIKKLMPLGNHRLGTCVALLRRYVHFNRMIDEKLEHFDVRLRGLEERKGRKECLQEVRNTKAKGRVEKRMWELGLMKWLDQWFEDEDEKNEDKDEIKGLIWVYYHIANKREESGHM
ncbi:hypothetical protein Tco_0422597 [Tanacetum coccineum]